MTFLGNVTDTEKDCQKPTTGMSCRGKLFAPPSVSGCPNLPIPTFSPVNDFSYCAVTSYAPSCEYKAELEDAVDANLAAANSTGSPTFICVRLEAAAATFCGAGGVLRVWYVRYGVLYPALLDFYYFGQSVRSTTVCLRTPVIPSITRTPTATRSITGSLSSTRSVSPSTSFSATGTQSPNTLSPSASAVTPSPSISLSGTATLSRSVTAAATVSVSLTASVTPSGTDWDSMRRAYASLQAAASEAAAAAEQMQAAVRSQLAQQQAVASQAIAAAEAAYAVLNATGNATAVLLVTGGTVGAPDNPSTFPWWLGLIIGLLLLALLVCCCFWGLAFLPQRRRLRALEEERERGTAAEAAKAGADAEAAAREAEAAHRYSRRRLRYSKGGVQPPSPAGGAKGKPHQGGPTPPAASAGSTRGGALASQLAFAAGGRRGPAAGASSRGGNFVYDANPLLKRPGAAVAPAGSSGTGSGSGRPMLAIVPSSTRQMPKSASSHRSLGSPRSGTSNGSGSGRGAPLVHDDDASSVASSVAPAPLPEPSLRALAAAVDSAGPEASAAAAAAAADASGSPAAAAASRPLTSEELMASLSFPLDATTAAYLGVDPASGAITNLAAHWAYLRYLEGYDYGTVYEIYAAQLQAAAAEGADTDASMQAALADVNVGASSAAARRTRGHSVRSGRLLLPPPAASGPPPMRLEIGTGNVKSSVVVKERVLLRKVSKIRGDKGFSVTSPIAFEGVKERRDVEIATARRTAASLTSPAPATGGAGAGAGAGGASS